MARLNILISFFLMIGSNIHKVTSINGTDVITISTEGCTIPGFPLISDSINEFVGPPHTWPNCSTAVPLLASNSSHIWIVREAFDYYNILWEHADFYCCYSNFSAQNNLENIVYEQCIQFTSNIKAEHEFVRIECYYMDNKVYDDYFLFFDMNKMEINPSSDMDSTSFNILILGIESMSRMNFLRTMPKTSEYLRNKGSVQLLGYNKLGDNSFPNLFPLLTGKSFQNVKENYISNNAIDTGSCPFLWDTYKQAGYYTALGADSSAGLLGHYEYSLPVIPTDFYLQPFMYETRNTFHHKDYEYHICLRNKILYKMLLNYAQDLSNKARYGKLFGIFWEETMSHERLNYPYLMDEDYVNFLNTLDKNDFLDRTVVVLFSDHGMRFGKIVQTAQGRLESSLPVIEFLFPTAFRRRYRQAFKNLKNNRLRLTTPFDVHETLLDIVKPAILDDQQIKERSGMLDINSNRISLFLPIPENRTCQTVGISEQWCTCRKGKQRPYGHKLKNLAARHLMAHINKLLSKYPQCHVLRIEQILDFNFVENENVQGHAYTYTMVIKAKPGGGIFDGTLVRVRRLWVVSGTVSRLNRYRGQSDCVADSEVKMYCYCIDSASSV